MPSNNRIIVASAGSGKTSTIVERACAAPMSRAALVTYTTNNTSGIEKLIYQKVGYIPPHLTIGSWYSFLLRHLVRPYQKAMHPKPVKRLHFHNGISAQYSRESDIGKHYFGAQGCIYVDKVSKFACQLIQQTDGAPICRMEQIFDHLYIDEVQDLAGWDLELVETLLKSRIGVTLVGDHRQATFSTNSALKNKKYSGAKIILKFEEWQKANLCELEFQTISHRCVQPICDLADTLHPGLPKTKSMNSSVTAHDGVFAVRQRDVGTYILRYKPQTLRYSRVTRDVPGAPINYGAAKGMTFERTLIFPNLKLRKFLLSGKPEDAGDIAKTYVAITRARQSTAFVIADSAKSPLMQIFQP
jgi:DNA helicase-2/ATP-dependent DNA helicase PcrA